MHATMDDRKSYNRQKLWLGILSGILSFCVLIAVFFSGLSDTLARWVMSQTEQPYIQFLLYLFTLGLLQSIVTFPLSFYNGYILEHRYRLSNQSFKQWCVENVKGLTLGIVIGVPLLLIFFYTLRNFGFWWWLPLAGVLFLFSVLLARIAPTLIFPLFYTFKPVEKTALVERITHLCLKAGLQVQGVFEFNLSKTTKKANAAFAGIGKSKRILLGDTLLQQFSDDEIEVVFAHEAGHYAHRHITKGMIWGILSTFGGLCLTAFVYDNLFPVFEYTDRAELGALPLIAILLSLYNVITTPAGHILSRRHEREADAYALRETKNRAAFISAMQRLSDTNLADENPHPLVEWYFYSHPAIGKRIAAAETMILE